MGQKEMLRHLFGRRLRSLRKERRMTQERLALTAGCNTSYLGLVERGQRAASLRVIEKLSRALQLPPIALFDFSETPGQKTRRDELLAQFQALVRDPSLHDLISVTMENIKDYRRGKSRQQ